MRAAHERIVPSAAIGPATVLASSGRKVVARLDSGVTVTADLALDTAYAPRPGDRLLVASSDEGAWAIAVLTALREATEPLVAPDGTRAELRDGRLSLTDREGRLLFEHRPDEQLSIVHAPHGDLRLSAPLGSIELEAARDVRVRGAKEIALEARDVRLSAPARGEDNHLRLDRSGVDVRTFSLRASAAEAKVAFVEATFAARTVTAAVDRLRTVLGVAETTAERIFERARETYREVEELAQTRAGRIRYLARDLLSLEAKQARVEAEDDVAVKGRKIHLS